MKALIFPFQKAEALAPLRSLCPDFLLPLAGKPMVEHLVDQLVTVNIQEITLFCDDMPDETDRHFGNGERWGCRLSLSVVREQAGLQRMVRAALHGIEGLVLCLPGNLVVTEELSRFLSTCAVAGELSKFSAAVGNSILAVDAGDLRALSEECRFESLEELIAAARMKGLLPATSVDASELLSITTLTGFLQIQGDILEEQHSGSRIPARSAGKGIWIGDHTLIEGGIQLVAPLMIGSHCRISGSGQIGPNAVISPYCLINNTDLISNSLVMSGTATGPHTELNSMAARGSILVNLRNGTVVSAPDAFILGEVSTTAERTSTGFMSSVTAICLLLLLLPLGVPLLLVSLLVPGLVRTEPRLGNRRMRTLTDEHPRMPFTWREFTFGPLLLRRWPGFFSILAGHVKLVGARAEAVESSESDEVESIFGLDVARGLFYIWEVEGDLPESVDEQHARENFHDVTRTFGADLAVVMKAATTFSRA